MSDALLVIDMQEVYVGEHRFPYLKYSMPDLLTTVNGVIDAYADEKRLIVIHKKRDGTQPPQPSVTVQSV